MHERSDDSKRALVQRGTLQGTAFSSVNLTLTPYLPSIYQTLISPPAHLFPSTQHVRSMGKSGTSSDFHKMALCIGKRAQRD